jgi:DNA-binding transcriptional LysR family regulator
MLDPRRLLTFREVARQRSFSRAAAALSLTQPAVSQQVRALEVQLGARLIERGRGGFELTDAGALLLAHADAVGERLDLAETQFGETVAGERRVLRVGAFPTVMGSIVPPAIARLSPEPLEVSVVQGGTEELVAGVRSGSLHLALCFQDAAAPRREHEGTRRHELLEEPMLVGVGPNHRFAARKRVRLADFARDTWLAALRDGLIHRACVSAGFEPRIAYLTGDPLAIQGFVAADLAVTLVSGMLAGQLSGISTMQIGGEPVLRAIYAVVPPTAPHPLAAPFLDALRAEARSLESIR